MDKDMRASAAPPLMYRMLLLWLFISAMYYIDTLLTANFAVAYDEGVYHKVVKYAVCMVFSTYFLLTTRNFGLLALSLVMLAIAATMSLMRGKLELSMLVMLTVGTMGGFVATLHRWPRMGGSIAAFIVYTAVVVGVLSALELTVLSALFQSYYAYTDGVRSVSTLFNPNNLGMYTGVALIFLPFIERTRYTKMVLALPILLAFFASGSRTAWLATALVGILMILFDRDIRRLAARYLLSHAPLLAGLAFLCLSALAMLTAETSEQVDSAHRGADLYTASIRIENFFSYLDGMDWTNLLPDYQGRRSHLIQDNFYLIILSAFGALPLLCIALLFLTQMALFWRGDLPNRLWRWVFLYYMITGMSGSFLNSFPNNQLFFISMGAFFVSTTSARSRQAAPAPHLLGHRR